MSGQVYNEDDGRTEAFSPTSGAEPQASGGVEDHYRLECSEEEEVECKFPGCNSMVKRCKVEDHNTENMTAHLDKVLVAFVELKSKNNDLEKSLVAVKHDLETSLVAVKQDLETSLVAVKQDLWFGIGAMAKPGTFKFIPSSSEGITFTNSHTNVKIGHFVYNVDIDGVLEPGKCLDLTCVDVQGRSGNVTFKASTEGKSHDLDFIGVENGQILRLVLLQDGVLLAMVVGKASHPAPATAWPMGTATKVKIVFSVDLGSTNFYSLN